jgi:hypothetical protein
MSRGTVTVIEAYSVGAEQPFHAGDQIRLRSLDHEMKMIGQQAIGMDPPARLLACLAKSREESPVIVLVRENRFTAIASIDQVVTGSGNLNAQWPRHGDESNKRNNEVNSE